MRHAPAAGLWVLALAAAAPAAFPATPPAAAGPPAAVAQSPVPTDKDAEEIRTVIKGLHEAMAHFFSSGEIEPVMRYYEVVQSYFPPFGEPQDPSGVRARLNKHAPHIKDYQSVVGPVQVNISGNLAVVTCEVDEQYAFDGKPGREHLLSTYVLERRSGRWQIVHEHQSMRTSESASP